MTDLTHLRLKEVLDYDPLAGIFRRRESKSNRTKVGAVTGTKPASRGYALIHIDGRRYYAHRLAWLYVHGEFPGSEIDHINRNKLDNRIANLRLATRGQNCANTRTRSASGYRGVYLCRGRYRAQITVGCINRNLGDFDCPLAAHRAYLAASAKHFGEFSEASRISAIETHLEKARALLSGGSQ